MLVELFELDFKEVSAGKLEAYKNIKIDKYFPSLLTNLFKGIFLNYNSCC